MSFAFGNLSENDLEALIAALRTGRLTHPFSLLQINRIVKRPQSEAVRNVLLELSENGFTENQVALALDMIVQERTSRRAEIDEVDLVTSGPRAPGVSHRDTAVVVRELFAHAERSVLVVGYAVYQGQKVFESLAARMQERPDLNVRFYLNVPRPDHDDTPSNILIDRFERNFKDTQWPGDSRVPEVYFDPRSVRDDAPLRSSLHAKCIVVDQRDVFVSSANFTEAGQQRNIEVGLHVESELLALQLTRHFEHLRDADLMRRAF